MPSPLHEALAALFRDRPTTRGERWDGSMGVVGSASTASVRCPMLRTLVRAFVTLLLSVVALVWAALGGAAPMPLYDAPIDATLRAGHDHDDRVGEGRERARMLRAATAKGRGRLAIGSTRIRIASFDDLDEDEGCDDGAPTAPAPAQLDDEVGAELEAVVHRLRARDDRAVVAAIEQRGALGPSRGVARRYEHPPEA